MALILVLGLSFAAASGVLVLRALGLAHAERRRTLDKIAAYGFHTSVPAAAEPADKRTALGDLATRAGEKALARFDGLRSGEGRLRKLLTSAGMYQTSVASFVGARILATLVGPTILILFAFTGQFDLRVFFSCALLTAMGWYMPYVVVRRRARLRVELIDREVPELVDLLVTTVEAGVGFASALQLASRSIEGPLGQELRLALREQSLGLTPEEALRNVTARVESPAMRAFTQALLQGESLGVSIGAILRDLAVDMRKRRRQSAEERAQKTPTKILFPLIVLILPAMFIVVLGPALLDIVSFLGAS
ncbi:MAG TPA: type II secretion system F family protein [Gaiellaceae bacterium]|nr:type II secretion system F family protein [Gaiellaceae bacterium]